MKSRRHIPGLQIGIDLVQGISAEKGTGGSRMRSFTAVVHREDDLWVALCPEVGTSSQGYTIDEAVANLRVATELYLEEFPTPKVSRSLVTTFEVKSV